MTFEDYETEFKKWFLLEDDLFLRIVTATVSANRFIDGKPLWLITIGIAGSGKTAVITAMHDCKFAITVDTLNPKAFLSFDTTSNSLLPRLNQRIMIVPDMSSITGLQNDEKKNVFGFLRAAYDGEFVRFSGKGDLTWKGKFGFIGCATNEIEREREMMSSLGERFIYLRPVLSEMNRLMDAVLKNSANESAMQNAIRGLTNKYWDEFSPNPDRTIRGSSIDMLKDCALIVCRARSGVLRDHYTKQVEAPIELTEAPTRFLKQLVMLTLGLKSLGTTDDDCDRCVLRVSRDCIPYTRMKALKAIHEGHGRTQNDIGKQLRISQAQVSRTLEELQGLNLVSYDGQYELSAPSVVRVIEAK